MGGHKVELPVLMSAAGEICQQIDAAIRAGESLKKQAAVIEEIAERLVSAFRNGNKVVFFGNGGSAADAQHLAAELAGRYHMDREPLPAIALTTNTSVLTAVANDYGYEQVFARQVKALVRPGDVAVGISTSGNSPSVIFGLEEAARCGAITVAFTGPKGKLKNAAELAVCVASSDTPHIQEAHITAGHIICGLVEQAMYGVGGTARI